MKKSKGNKLKKAIRRIRLYLAEEYISPLCASDPCIGCGSCNAIELDRKLVALRNEIGE